MKKLANAAGHRRPDNDSESVAADDPRPGPLGSLRQAGRDAADTVRLGRWMRLQGKRQWLEDHQPFLEQEGYDRQQRRHARRVKRNDAAQRALEQVTGVGELVREARRQIQEQRDLAGHDQQHDPAEGDRHSTGDPIESEHVHDDEGDTPHQLARRYGGTVTDDGLVSITPDQWRGMPAEDRTAFVGDAQRSGMRPQALTTDGVKITLGPSDDGADVIPFPAPASTDSEDEPLEHQGGHQETEREEEGSDGDDLPPTLRDLIERGDGTITDDGAVSVPRSRWQNMNAADRVEFIRESQELGMQPYALTDLGERVSVGVSSDGTETVLRGSTPDQDQRFPGSTGDLKEYDDMTQAQDDTTSTAASTNTGEITSLASAQSYTTEVAGYLDGLHTTYEQMSTGLSEVAATLRQQADGFEAALASLSARGLGDSPQAAALQRSAERVQKMASDAEQSRDVLSDMPDDVTGAAGDVREAAELFERQADIGERMRAEASDSGVADDTEFYTHA